MAEYTSNLYLEKPSGNENFRRQVINDNMDKVDKKFDIATGEGHTHDGTVGQGKKISYNNLSDKPTAVAPTAHKSTHEAGAADALDSADIGAAAQADFSAHLADYTAHGLCTEVINTPSITLGSNLIKHTGKVPVYPEIEFAGMHYVNPLGRDGDCEDISKWNVTGGTFNTDTTTKQFGNSSFKITSTGTGYAVVYKTGMSTLVDITKSHLLSAYVKNGTAPSTGIGASQFSAVSADTTKFVRIGVILTPAQMDSVIIWTGIASTETGQTGWVDGVMLNQLTDADVTEGLDACLARYPYVESCGCLQNPYFENKRYNLVRNGNGEEGTAFHLLPNGGGTISIENGYFKLTNNVDTGVYYAFSQRLLLKPNTSYTISAKIKRGTHLYGLRFYGNLFNDMGVNVSAPWDITVTSTTEQVVTATFTTADDCNLLIGAIDCIGGGSTGTNYIKEIMLIEGTTAPIEYLSCDLQRFVIEGRFLSGDKLLLKDGKLSGQLWWKHKTLYGKDYNWKFSTDYAGYKFIYIPATSTGLTWQPSDYIAVKYDGNILPHGYDTANKFLIDVQYSACLTIANTDSGWTESIIPNDDEVKAFVNGWKAVNSNGTRYIAWLSVLDGSVPSGSINTTVTMATTSATQTVTAGTGIRFAANNLVILVRDGANAGVLTVSSVTEDSITFTASYTSQVGDIFFKQDDGSINVSLLTWCKNNIAPNYEGYRLHDKLVNPEPITDANVHVQGDIWNIVPGDNYVNIDSGIVLGEVANPGDMPASTSYVINDAYPMVLESILKNKAENILSVYKNNIADKQNWIDVYDPAYSYGKLYAYCKAANFDANATYTVDYQILKTLHAQSFSSLTMEYAQDVFTAIASIAGALEDKQQHDSALDTLIDLSMYEEMVFNPAIDIVPWVYNGSNALYITVQKVYSAQKKVKPIVSLKNFVIKAQANSYDVTSKFNINYVVSTKDKYSVNFITQDAITITQIKNNGVSFGGTLVADCRGRI